MQENSKVLVIDDDRAMRELLHEVLASAGYDVAVAADGRDGLDKVEQTRFHAIVTDLWMPKMDGVSTIVAVRRTDKNIPIILMTGVDKKEQLLITAEHLGATYVIKKPFDNDALVSLLDTAIAKNPPDCCTLNRKIAREKIGGGIQI